MPMVPDTDLPGSKVGLCPDPPKAKGLWKPAP